MSKRRKRHRFKKWLPLVYTALLLGIGYQLYSGIERWRKRPFTAFHDTFHTVTVSGNVQNPGSYRVPRGTSKFEILQVAGIRSTSDIRSVDILSQISGDDQLEVGTLQEPAAVVGSPGARVEFFFGQILLQDSQGKQKMVEEATPISSKDVLQAMQQSQVEVSLGNYSRIDLDAGGQLVFDELQKKEGEKIRTSLFHKTGVAWYKIVYTEKNELMIVNTPLARISVGGAGADFTIENDIDGVTIHNNDGLLLVEQITGDEAVNLISGQSVFIAADGRPFQVTHLTETISANERFSQLQKEKSAYTNKYMPLSFLFCGVPGSYYLLHLRFESSEFDVVNIPSATSVAQFAQGFETIGQSFLYGGVVFVSTLVEQILNVRINHYAIFTPSDVIRTASALGGIRVQVDGAAATYLNIPSGLQQLDSRQMVQFMSPGISGQMDAKRRQMEVIKSLFENVKSGDIVLTALLADQILTNVETNMSSSDVMKQFSKFQARDNWKYNSVTLPTAPAVIRGKVMQEPDLELSRKLLLSK